MYHQTGMNKLLSIMDQLRSDKGCPWDRKQTMESLKPFLIEETYEVLEAIESGDKERVREELGDLLLQIVFLSQIGREEQAFSFEDVVQGINEKLLRRHPHVFGDEKAENAEEVLHRWEQIKREEKKGKERRSILDGIPQALPALIRAGRLQDRAARVGFDWKETSEVLNKVEEEFQELKHALKKNDPSEIEHELGDILFALVNLSRFIRVSSEDALRKSTQRFISRFQYIEEYAVRNELKLHTLSLQEMDRLWEEAKSLEKSQ
ncbi:MAG: nucleoside triphosphate pyrophosphohydrolase [Nitrospirae bacterium CG_4_9_14_3_um_filter_53_35]|nr:MAG: nucleoside triphosphate pyrophosphohydrolase [Nitrospirae bacterium CG17_big_fil_post_rev_8_21_14_2_50_50_9]PIX85723.1 MAG: nucleoside triphosphate pyrophosphohydrolase [Nitrospirae bacterium CG_4_10_14_3_um_filter_53_41]PJA77441.1 MAG: nucleoside triphosphate pyrophosphohydrolase [Nitrospirae bacterium CG_4_9_14_3_um_filter_53_35]